MVIKSLVVFPTLNTKAPSSIVPIYSPQFVLTTRASSNAADDSLCTALVTRLLCPLGLKRAIWIAAMTTAANKRLRTATVPRRHLKWMTKKKKREKTVFIFNFVLPCVYMCKFIHKLFFFSKQGFYTKEKKNNWINKGQIL